MIKYAIFALGVTLAAGSGLVAIGDTGTGASRSDPALDLLMQWENRAARAAYDQANSADQRRASLPQSTNSGAAEKHYSRMTGEEELREMAKHNPHVKEYVDLLDARLRDEKWGRIRHKAQGAAGTKPRLGDIHNRPTADGKPKDVSMEEYDRMGMLDQIRHRSSIKKNRSKKTVQQGGSIQWKKKRD